MTASQPPSMANPRLLLPDDVALPCFVYGAFKPGELGYSQLSEFVAETVEAVVMAKLWLRDGLPLLELCASPNRRVDGFLLNFESGRADQAYAVIGAFEPRHHYRWVVTDLEKPATKANVLVGRRLEKGSVPAESRSWSGHEDPVFSFGLDEVKRIARESAGTEFPNSPELDWPKFFRLQMAYLLLWSAIERYTAFAYGPGLDPVERVKRLGNDSLFVAAAQDVIKRSDCVYDSRDPDQRYDLKRDKPENSSLYFYGVRSNLSHRGKGAYADGEKVRKSLNELLAIFDRLLAGSRRAGGMRR